LLAFENMSLGLLGAYESDIEDSEYESSGEEDVPKNEDREEGPVEALANPFGTVASLPQPSFMQEQHGSVSGLKFDSSVFSNPFRDKEEKKKAILEQHVNMTQRQEELKVIDGKKVCWMYRKGRCRQGAQCKFAHDNDVKTNRVHEVKYDADSQISSEKCHQGAVEQIKLNPVHNAEEEVVMRKKRPGLSQGIVPSKKAMKFHKKVYATN